MTDDDDAILEPCHETCFFAYAKTKALISCAGTTKKQIGCAVTNQRLCFRYKDITIILLSKSKISSFQLSSVAVLSPVCVRPGRQVFSRRGSL